MQAERPERRKSKRVFFSETDDIIGTFTLSGHHDRIIRANISDLCEEGFCLILQSHDKDAMLQQGDHWILTNVKGGENLSFLTDIEIEVKWTLDFKHLAIGCEFFNPSQRFIDQIRKFIDSREEHP